jgi:hypothetical protein
MSFFFDGYPKGIKDVWKRTPHVRVPLLRFDDAPIFDWSSNIY